MTFTPEEVEARRRRAWQGAAFALVGYDYEHGPVEWWWCSFTDPDEPEGRQFLGLAIVDVPQVDDELIAATLPVARCWELDVNPGGQVAMTGPLPPEAIAEHVPVEHRRRLLRNRAELEAVGVDVDAGAAVPFDER